MRKITLRFHENYFVVDDVIKSEDGRFSYIVIGKFNKTIEVSNLDESPITELPTSDTLFFTVGHMIDDMYIEYKTDERRKLPLKKVDDKAIFNLWKDLHQERVNSRKTFNGWLQHLKREAFYADNVNMFWHYEFTPIRIEPPKSFLIKRP
jgi:hypothetical protein